LRAKDTGTLQYEVHVSDGQYECIVLERRRDSEAVLEHGANLGDIAGLPCHRIGFQCAPG
jgi:hypothetical protein